MFYFKLMCLVIKLFSTLWFSIKDYRPNFFQEIVKLLLILISFKRMIINIIGKIEIRIMHEYLIKFISSIVFLFNH